MIDIQQLTVDDHSNVVLQLMARSMVNEATNTIGSLRSADVSRSITVPMASAQSGPQVIVQESKDLKEIIARLNERLDEPFVTAGTVIGDKGIKTCASRTQTSSLDLLRRSQVYPTRRRTSTSAS